MLNSYTIPKSWPIDDCKEYVGKNVSAIKSVKINFILILSKVTIDIVSVIYGTQTKEIKKKYVRST